MSRTESNNPRQHDLSPKDNGHGERRSMLLVVAATAVIILCASFPVAPAAGNEAPRPSEEASTGTPTSDVSQETACVSEACRLTDAPAVETITQGSPRVDMRTSLLLKTATMMDPRNIKQMDSRHIGLQLVDGTGFYAIVGLPKRMRDPTGPSPSTAEQLHVGVRFVTKF
jgi:hypothetical protein